MRLESEIARQKSILAEKRRKIKQTFIDRLEDRSALLDRKARESAQPFIAAIKKSHIIELLTELIKTENLREPLSNLPFSISRLPNPPRLQSKPELQYDLTYTEDRGFDKAWQENNHMYGNIDTLQPQSPWHEYLEEEQYLHQIMEIDAGSIAVVRCNIELSWGSYYKSSEDYRERKFAIQFERDSDGQFLIKNDSGDYICEQDWSREKLERLVVTGYTYADYIEHD